MATTKEITRTLGGERLGAGGKMKVNMHAYNRSTHDLSRAWRSSMNVGTLVPFFVELAENGDTFSIDLDNLVRTMPATAPLYGSYKLQLDMFSAPIRLYNGLLHNNMTKLAMNMDKVKFPKMLLSHSFKPTAQWAYKWNGSQIATDSLLHYLGISGIGNTNSAAEIVLERKFNAVPMLAYWDIYKNYYANQQEEKGMYIGLPPTRIEATNLTYITDNIRRRNRIFKATGESTVPTGLTPIEPEYQELEQHIFLNEWKAQYQVHYNGKDFIKTEYGIYIHFNGVYFDKENMQVIIKMNGTESVEDLSTIWQSITTDNDSIILDNPDYTYVKANTEILGFTYKTQQQAFGKTVLKEFPLSNIDNARITILQNTGLGNELITNTLGIPYSEISGTYNGICSSYFKQLGLAIKTYQSDLLNNWVNTEWIDGPNGINQITAIDTSSGSFTIDAMNLAKKVYNMMNRIAVSKGTYEDWQEVVFSTDAIRRAETPIYLGGQSAEIVFEEVVSNTGTEEQPLGTLAGKGTMIGKRGGAIEYRAEEPSFIIGIASITPRLDYSQGNKWYMTELDSMNDLHKPELDAIGFQDLLQERAAWWGTIWEVNNQEWVKLAMGKQPAWVNYMTAINETHGDFADEDKCMFMTLNRQYERGTNILSLAGRGIKDVTTYIDPTKYQYTFADNTLDAQNFWVQIGIRCEARRVMSAKVIPQM